MQNTSSGCLASLTCDLIAKESIGKFWRILSWFMCLLSVNRVQVFTAWVNILIFSDFMNLIKDSFNDCFFLVKIFYQIFVSHSAISVSRRAIWNYSLESRSSHQRWKKLSLKITQNWSENICVRVSFLIKFEACNF